MCNDLEIIAYNDAKNTNIKNLVCLIRVMPRNNARQINLTMAKTTHDIIRKAWDAESDDKKLSSWALEIILQTIEKDKWLKKYAPHLSYVGTDKNGILLRDKHLKDSIVEVTLLDNRLWCQVCKEKNCMHVYFTMARPELSLVPDPEKPRKMLKKIQKT